MRKLLSSPQMVNQFQNIALIALSIVAARRGMNAADVELWASIIGAGATLFSNHYTVRGGTGDLVQPGRQAVPNGATA